MARIRTIKPEFWTSEQVVECSPIARLLFIGMWNFCDDYGNHPVSTKQLKMEIFPGDNFTMENIDVFIEELINNDLVTEYQGDDNKYYWHVNGWRHQKIEKPNCKYPKFADQSPTSRRPVVDQSPEEGKGRERKGKERSGGGKETEYELPPPPPTFEEFSEFAKAHKPLIQTHKTSQLMNRYKTWEALNWIDKDGNSICNYWKAKLLATLPYIEKDEMKNQNNYPKRQRLN